MALFIGLHSHFLQSLVLGEKQRSLSDDYDLCMIYETPETKEVHPHYYCQRLSKEAFYDNGEVEHTSWCKYF